MRVAATKNLRDCSRFITRKEQIDGTDVGKEN